MTSLRFVTWLTCLTSLLILTQGQDIDYGTCSQGCDGSCCTYFVMDNPLMEIIDANTTVEPGIYYGMAVKLCADKPFAMGLWAPDPSRDDIQVLQHTWAYPGVSNRWVKIIRNGETYTALNFTTPLNVTRRLYWGVMGISEIIPIPYSNDSPRSRSITYRFHSIQLGSRFNGQPPAQRIPGTTRVRVQPFNWPRTFRDFVHFCGAPGCIDEALCVGCRGPRGFPGPPGPPGPAGAATPPFFGCDDPENPIGNGINNLANQADQIINRLIKVESDVNKIPKGDRDTGVCPRNYISGSYGIGYCYNAWTQQSKSFGEAALLCAAVEGSHLVDIERAEEDEFLADYILPMFREGETNLTFFTSGLFSGRFRDWVWYSDQVLIRKTIGTYSNWAPGEQDGHEKKRTCLVYQVFRDKTTKWISSSCTDKRGYICKSMKKCF